MSKFSDSGKRGCPPGHWCFQCTDLLCQEQLRWQHCRWRFQPESSYKVFLFPFCFLLSFLSYSDAYHKHMYLWRLSAYRKFRNLDLPSSLLKSAPESCAVYIISSKGKLQSSRPAASQPQMPSGDALIPKQPPLGERPSVIQPDSPRSVEIGR